MNTNVSSAAMPGGIAPVPARKFDQKAGKGTWAVFALLLLAAITWNLGTW